MPQRDRTGPQGEGPKTGKGRGRCNPTGGNSAPWNQGGTGTGKGKSRRSGRCSGRGQGKGRVAEPGRGRRS